MLPLSQNEPRYRRLCCNGRARVYLYLVFSKLLNGLLIDITKIFSACV